MNYEHLKSTAAWAPPWTSSSPRRGLPPRRDRRSWERSGASASALASASFRSRRADSVRAPLASIALTLLAPPRPPPRPRRAACSPEGRATIASVETTATARRTTSPQEFRYRLQPPRIRKEVAEGRQVFVRDFVVQGWHAIRMEDQRRWRRRGRRRRNRLRLLKLRSRVPPVSRICDLLVRRVQPALGISSDTNCDALAGMDFQMAGSPNGRERK